MTSARPLSGIKVVELARILAGPWCGQLLADLGAEVVMMPTTRDLDNRSVEINPLLHAQSLSVAPGPQTHPRVTSLEPS